MFLCVGAARLVALVTIWEAALLRWKRAELQQDQPNRPVSAAPLAAHIMERLARSEGTTTVHKLNRIARQVAWSADNGARLVLHVSAVAGELPARRGEVEGRADEASAVVQ